MLVDTILLPRFAFLIVWILNTRTYGPSFSLRFLILELVVACHYLDYTQAFRVFGETSADHSQHHGQDSDRTKENLITYVDGEEAVGMPAKINLSDGKRKESTQQKASPTVTKRKEIKEYEKHHKI